MPPEPDDNPFGRVSVWPKMPQAPFKIGGLPRVAARPLRPESGPTFDADLPAITPVFTRPADSAQLSLLTRSLVPTAAPVAPRATPNPAPAVPRAPEPSPPPQALSPPPAPVAAPEVPPAAALPHELEPLIVVAPVRRAKAEPSRSPWPMLAAGVAAIALVAILIFYFNRAGQAAAPKPAAAAAAAPVPAQAAAPLQVAPPTPAPTVAPAAPPAAAAVAPPTRPRLARRDEAPREAAPPPVERAAPAAAAPVVEIAPPPPPTPAPAPPQPAYKPPPAPDPNAPMTTQRRD